MFDRVVLLVAALLCVCTGESSLGGPAEVVLAQAGGDAILPCTFGITTGDEFPTVEWSKEGLQPDVIFLYRDGCETYEMKNPAFEYRTSLILKELKNRNVSLRISNVRLSDAGRYHCMRLWRNAPRDVTTVELVVEAVSEPKLSVVSVEGGAVTVQCEATCWLPEPQIHFLDERGHDIPAGDQKRRQDASRCYSVTRRATLPEATRRVTCRVQQPQINRTRDTQILVAGECMRSSCLITGVAVGLSVFFLSASCGFVYSMWKRCGRCGNSGTAFDTTETHKRPLSRMSSTQSTLSASSTKHQLLLKTDDEGNAAVEKLTREVAELKSQLLEKEEIIRQLPKITPQHSPVVCQLGQPTIVCSPSKYSPDVPKPFSQKARNVPKDPKTKPAATANSNPTTSGHSPQIQCPNPSMSRVKSSPALFNLIPASGSTSASTLKKRSSESRAHLDRRHSFAFPTPHMSNNRFRLLAELNEESEQLVSDSAAQH